MMKLLVPATIAALTLFAATGARAAEINPLADVKVRQAIAYAIDMDTIVETLLDGKAIVADSMIPNGPFKAPGLNAYSYDPDKARELLEEANYDTSQTLDVVYYYGDQQTADLMVAIQSYLADVGIKMTYRKLEGDVGAQLNALPEPGSDTSAVKWNMAYGARAALALQEYYNGYKTGRSSYTPGDPTRDELIAATNATADIATQKTAFFALEEYENDKLSDIPLYYQQIFDFSTDRLDRHGAPYGDAQYNYDWGIVNWTAEPDASGKSVAYTNGGPEQFFEYPWFNPGIYFSSKAMFDHLITADASLTPTEGQLAESYDVSDDGLTVTFDLREGLTWHDGEPLTGEDVKWSIETALKVPAIHSVFANTFNSIAGAADYKDGKADHVAGITVDGQKIVIEFATLDPNVLLTFSQFAPLPKHLLEDTNPLKFQQDNFWQHPIGSGPYKLESVRMGDYARFVPFENYWGGIAKIDEIVALPSGENDANIVKNAAAHRLDFGFTKSVASAQALEKLEFMQVIPVNTNYTRSLRINAFPMRAD